MRVCRCLAMALWVGGLLGCGADDEGPGPGGSGGGGTSPTPAEPPTAGARQQPCAPSERELDGACMPAGVPEDGCGEGFTHRDAGCDAVLPAQACPDGELALMGETSCRPVAPCGTGPWGDIPVDATTIYVDQAHAGPSDGSSSQPFTTLTAALAAAQPGDLIAVAPGTYSGHAVLDQPVRLWGKCPAEVTLTASAVPDATVLVTASNVEVHTLSVSGADFGIGVDGALDVVLDRVWVHDTGGVGVQVQTLAGPASLTVRDSLIESATLHGLFDLGGAVTVERSVVRETRPGTDGTLGRGITAREPSGAVDRTSLALDRVLLEDLHEYGVRGSATVMTIDDSLIRRVVPQSSDQVAGIGIEVRGSISTGLLGEAVVRGTVVEQVSEEGIVAKNAELHVERTVVRNVAEAAPDAGGTSNGIRVQATQEVADATAHLTLTESLVERTVHRGVRVDDGVFDLTGVVVRDVEVDGLGEFGIGVSISGSVERSTGTIAGLLAERLVGIGVFVQGSDVDAQSVMVRDV
ncbi:MAG: DUF1565 domain-containing protein, partial [Deltaproteobacteria bacterium]|nr:DUF1565 domain-containing protein [Deltaproteobacteria bacterium]